MQSVLECRRAEHFGTGLQHFSTSALQHLPVLFQPSASSSRNQRTAGPLRATSATGSVESGLPSRRRRSRQPSRVPKATIQISRAWASVASVSVTRAERRLRRVRDAGDPHVEAVEHGMRREERRDVAVRPHAEDGQIQAWRRARASSPVRPAMPQPPARRRRSRPAGR